MSDLSYPLPIVSHKAAEGKLQCDSKVAGRAAAGGPTTSIAAADGSDYPSSEQIQRPLQHEERGGAEYNAEDPVEADAGLKKSMLRLVAVAAPPSLQFQADLKLIIDALEEYKQELKLSKWELSQAKEQISVLLHEQEEHQRTEIELEIATTTSERYKHELISCKRELRQATNQISELIHEKQRYKDHNSSLSHELMNVNRNLQDAKNLSDVRGKELLGSQVFLTKADSLSVSEVIDKVVALNEEIFQAAATLGESMVHHRYETSQEDMALAYESARTTIGEPILDILVSQSQKRKPEVNPLLVQVALQVYLVNFCASKAAPWYPSEDRAAGFLNMLYCDIRASEEQAVSGRWRAITRAHTRISSASEKWHTELTRTLSNVLKVSAWAASKDQRTSFEQRLPPIFKAVDDLRTALGEKFTSADLETSIIEPNTTFNTVYMEDAYGDGSQTGGKRVPPESVVGTTGIGLKKVVNTRGANGEIQYENVFSAKVALESTLKEALEPVPRLEERNGQILKAMVL
ncbi:hypothetical protein B0H34DRAFT_701537 [Crassisporium funariophilum]|nr:hypothetical protein B0H34DRAFT_701537 [Crassisporium funariophilum]